MVEKGAALEEKGSLRTRKRWELLGGGESARTRDLGKGGIPLGETGRTSVMCEEKKTNFGEKEEGRSLGTVAPPHQKRPSGDGKRLKLWLLLYVGNRYHRNGRGRGGMANKYSTSGRRYGESDDLLDWRKKRKASQVSPRGPKTGTTGEGIASLTRKSRRGEKPFIHVQRGLSRPSEEQRDTKEGELKNDTSERASAVHDLTSARRKTASDHSKWTTEALSKKKDPWRTLAANPQPPEGFAIRQGRYPRIRGKGTERAPL